MGSAGGATSGGARQHVRVPSPALTAAGWLAGVVVTALVLGTPYLLFGYHSRSMHLVLGTFDACVALLLSYLVYGRFLRSRLVQDLFLAQGLFLLAVAGMGLVLLLHLFHVPRMGTFDIWLPLALRSLGAALIALASLTADRRADRGSRHWWRFAPWLVAIAGGWLLWMLREHLPVALAATPPRSALNPVITGHPALLVAQGFAAACFMVASVAFTVRAVRRRDELLRWLGPACALAGFARANYVLFPSLYSDWLYTGDFLRTAGYLLLLVGAAREIVRYWSAQAEAAVLEDRRRLARELHDGLVQELAYIRAEIRLLPAGLESSERILAACDRAVDEARSAVDALGTGEDEPLGLVLQRAARQVADRYGARLEADVDASIEVTDDQRHALVRITREAVSNAIRHGGARCVWLGAHREGPLNRLVVRDDGKGFEVAAAQGTGYGLTSMRERAGALPGSFDVRSGSGRGTTVQVTW